MVYGSQIVMGEVPNDLRIHVSISPSWRNGGFYGIMVWECLLHSRLLPRAILWEVHGFGMQEQDCYRIQGLGL